MDRYNLYFRLSLMWLAAVVGGCAYLILHQ
jgi:hypothetical protein